MITQTKLSEITNLPTKELWWLFSSCSREYWKSPWTRKGELMWKKFQMAKQELKNRGEGYWN